MENVIEIQHLSKSFGANEVLKDINFSVKKGEVVCIIGSSGSGKSTLLRCINLLERPSGGKILYNGENILDEKHDIFKYRTKLGMVFQQFNLFENHNALSNCVVGQMKVLGRSREEAEEVALKFLKVVGMEQYINARPKQLSGGQKQRVAIAGVIAMRPEIIILDEPTAMLDPSGRREVMETIDYLNKHEGITIVHITHYMEEAIAADRVVVMEEGKIVAKASPREIFNQVETLKSIGLDVPQVTELAHQLRKEGIKIEGDPLSIEEMVEAICR